MNIALKISNLLAYPENKYMFKVNNRDTKKKCEICSKLTIKLTTSNDWYVMSSCHCRHSVLFLICIVNFEHISYIFYFFGVSTSVTKLFINFGNTK